MDEKLDAEGEVALARLALDGDDLAHALNHIGNAVTMAPSLPDVHEVIAEFVARAGGPTAALKHFDLSADTYIGTAAVYAHVLAAAQEWNAAVGLLFEVAASEPGQPWLDVAWLARPDLADLVRPDVLGDGLVQLVATLDSPVDEDARDPLVPALTFVRAMVARHWSDAGLLWRASMFVRRLGALDEAVEWASRSFTVEPSAQAAIARGYALMAAGRTDEALAAFIEEAHRTPDNLALYLDISDLYAQTGSYEEALDWAQRILAREPGHEKAHATVQGLRFAMDNRVDHLVALADEMGERPYSGVVLARYCDNQPWLDQVHHATEALTNVLVQLLEQHAPSPDVELTTSVSGLEPPSSLLAMHSVFPAAEVTFDAAPEPDLREPAEPVTHRVWRYDGMTALPAVPPPSPEASAAVQRLVTPYWDSPPEAYDRAVALATVDPRDLLGVMVHPPAFPDTEMGEYLRTTLPHMWIRGVQVWACMGLAHHRADEPWDSSTRRQVLVDLLNGPEDWVTEAAAFALVVTAWVDPSARSDAGRAVVLRMFAAAEAYRSREVTILESLCRLTLLLPGLPDEVGDLARDMINRQA